MNNEIWQPTIGFWLFVGISIIVFLVLWIQLSIRWMDGLKEKNELDNLESRIKAIEDKITEKES